MKRHSLFPDSRVIHIKKLRPQIFQTSGPYLHCLSSLPVAMHAIMSLVLCGVSLLVASAAASSSLRRESRLKDYESIALNSNLKFSERPQATEILADQSEAVVGAYYPSGWWMGEVTQSGGCDHDDLLGDNQVVNFEGYALNVCLFQGGNRMMYQCDGGTYDSLFTVRVFAATNFSICLTSQKASFKKSTPTTTAPTRQPPTSTKPSGATTT